jgi:creatinine amidohydrolase
MEPLLPVATSEDERLRDPVAAVLPIGSFEQHGPYLPLATDTIVACTIAKALADSYPVRYLAPVAISCSHEHKNWPGTISISARTLYAVVADIHESLRLSGLANLIVVNAHGGNYVLRNLVQESTVASRSMALFPTSTDWAAARDAAGMTTTDHEDMHAGEFETSILLHAHPELVRAGYEAGDHKANQRPGLLTLGMEGYTTSGIIGRPSLATAAKGETAIACLVDSFASCLANLGTARSLPGTTPRREREGWATSSIALAASPIADSDCDATVKLSLNR